MPDANYPVPASPTYDPAIRQLQDTDPASATNTFNPLVQKLINNTHAVKLKTDALDTAQGGFVPLTQKGAASGVASLGTDGKVPAAQLPDAAAVGVGYGTCTTASGTAAKIGALANFTLQTGSFISLKFTNTDKSTSPTLNVNSTGAKAIYYKGSPILQGMITAGYLSEFMYDGTYWQLLNPDNGFVHSAIVTAASWTAGTPNASGAFWYLATIADANIVAADVVSILPADEDSAEQIAEYLRPYVDTAAGAIKLYALAVPDNDINVYYAINKEVS